MLFRWALRFVGSCCFLFLLYFSLSQAQWEIGGVEIKKDGSHLSESSVSDILVPYLESSWLTINISQLQFDLLQEPWVSSVEVSRVFPDKIRLNIVEKKAVATFGSLGLVSSKGELFTPDVPVVDDLPQIISTKQDLPEVFSAFVSLREQEALTDQIPGDVKFFKYDAVNGWQAEFGDGLVVYFGRGDFKIILARFVSTYPRVLSSAKRDSFKKFDMRYAKGVAVA